MTREEALKQLRELKFALSGTDEQLLDIVALDMAIEALEQEPCKDADTISRQAAIRWVKTECNPYGKPTLDFESGKKVIEHLKRMSPVTPQPKTGYWIINEDEENTVHGHCSVCGWEAHYYEDDIIGMPYCPNCGAKMVGPQESEG